MGMKWENRATDGSVCVGTQTTIGRPVTHWTGSRICYPSLVELIRPSQKLPPSEGMWRSGSLPYALVSAALDVSGRLLASAILPQRKKFPDITECEVS